jgi:hypothetical protein
LTRECSCSPGDSGLGPGEGFKLSTQALTAFYAGAAGAQAALYSTWGRRDGDPTNADQGYGSFLGMNRLTGRGYAKYAGTLKAAGEDALLVPCGRAFELVHNATNGTGRFACLYNNKGDAGCTIDGAGKGGHPSPLGTYLIACIFATAIHGQTTVGVGWAPKGVSKADAAYMQAIAHQAVRGDASCKRQGESCSNQYYPCCAGLRCDWEGVGGDPLRAGQRDSSGACAASCCRGLHHRGRLWLPRSVRERRVRMRQAMDRSRVSEPPARRCPGRGGLSRAEHFIVGRLRASRRRRKVLYVCRGDGGSLWHRLMDAQLANRPHLR